MTSDRVTWPLILIALVLFVGLNLVALIHTLHARSEAKRESVRLCLAVINADRELVRLGVPRVAGVDETIRKCVDG